MRLRDPEVEEGPGEVLAVVDYDALSRISSVTYPSGTGNAGNGTELHDIDYDRPRPRHRHRLADHRERTHHLRVQDLR